MAEQARKIRLTKAELAKLPEYSVTLPTGTLVGKWWRRHRDKHTSIGTFVPSDKSGRIGIHWYDVKLVKEGGHEMKVSYDQERIDYANARLDVVEEERDAALSREADLKAAKEGLKKRLVERAAESDKRFRLAEKNGERWEASEKKRAEVEIALEAALAHICELRGEDE